MKEQIGEAQVLGRSSTIQDHPLLGAVHGKVYSRLLFEKMVLASSQYNRAEVEDDTLVSYREGDQLKHGVVDTGRGGAWNPPPPPPPEILKLSMIIIVVPSILAI